LNAVAGSAEDLKRAIRARMEEQGIEAEWLEDLLREDEPDKTDAADKADAAGKADAAQTKPRRKRTRRTAKKEPVAEENPRKQLVYDMDPIEQIRQDILRLRREYRYEKYPPKMTIDEDGDVFFEIPKEIDECKTADTEDLTLIGEIKLFDDPLIPVLFSFYYDDDDKQKKNENKKEKDSKEDSTREKDNKRDNKKDNYKDTGKSKANPQEK